VWGLSATQRKRLKDLAAKKKAANRKAQSGEQTGAS
jgi:hypothetical protein